MAEEGRLKVAILIVSDTAARDSSTDRTMSVLRDVLENDSHNWELAHTDIVPDDASKIQEAILPWTDGSDHVSLVVTSGGTGFATRDITPEVSGIPSMLLPAFILTRSTGRITVDRSTCARSRVCGLFLDIRHGR